MTGLRINPKHLKQSHHGILTIKTGTDQIALFCIPLGETTIIEALLTVFNKKRERYCSSGIP